jgi:hypothetical protein
MIPMRLHLTSLVCVAGLLVAPALAQTVPLGQSIVSVIANVAPGEGLWLFDRATGASSPITGLVAAGSVGSGVNAIAMDPIDDRIWLGGINNNGNTANQLNWIRLTGSVFSQFQQFATIAPSSPQSIAAIVFDDNANPVFCAGTASVFGGVFRADRRTGVVTSLGAVASGTHNALAKDAAGNIYVGMFGNGQVHVLTKNPDGSFQPPVLFGTVSNTSIFGLAFAPADGIRADEMFVACGGPATPLVSVIPIATGGAGTAVTTTQTLFNWIEYDQRNNDLLLAQTSPDRVIRLARAGGDVVLGNIGSSNIGTPSCLDSNDAFDGQTMVAPMILNGGLGPFDLELSTTAPPGSLVLIGTVAPSVQVLTVGIAGVDGRVFVKFPNLSLGASLPAASFQFLSAWFDSTLTLHLGGTVFWPAL